MPITSAGPRSRTGIGGVGVPLTLMAAFRPTTPGWPAPRVSVVTMAAATPWRTQGRKLSDADIELDMVIEPQEAGSARARGGTARRRD